MTKFISYYNICLYSAGSVSRRPSQNDCIRFTLYFTGNSIKVLEVHSLPAAAEKGKDDDFGASDDSGDVKERRFANCHYPILYQSKW